MAQTWQEITGRNAPVRGDVDAFDSARSYWLGAAQDADTIIADFRSIVDGGAAPLEGKSAAALQSILIETTNVLDDVPKVCRSLEQIMAVHQNRLKALQESADRALARAVTAWNSKQEAERNASSHSSRASYLRGQIAQLQSSDPENPQVATLESQLRSAESSASISSGDAANHERAIDHARKTADELETSERELNKATAGKLDEIDLLSLRNLSNAQKAWNATTDFLGNLIGNIGEFLENIGDLVNALFEGDWDKFFWELREICDQITAVLAVAALVAAVVVATVVTMGAAAPALVAFIAFAAKAALVLSAAKLAVDVGLYATNTVNPDTGQMITPIDLALDAVSVAFAAMGASQAMKLNNAYIQNYRGVLASKGIHVVRGYEVSVTMTREAVKREVVDHVRDSALDVAEDRLVEHLQDQTYQSRDTRVGAIEAGIQDLHSSDLGLSSNTAPCLVPANP